MEKVKNRGITLIALIITIIILLILAGISISALTGSGLFEKAKLAKEESENAQELENEILLNYQSQIEENIKQNNDKQEVVNLKKASATGSTIVPKMTSNTGLEGDIVNKLIVSHEYSQNNLELLAYNAFDKDNTSRWNSGAISGDEWPYIGCEFKEEVQVKVVDLTTYNDLTAVKNFKIQYSNDGINWTDATESLTAKYINTVQTFKIDKSVSAKYWRIQIEENYGYSSHNCSISEIQFFNETEEKYVVIPTMKSETETVESDNKYTIGKILTNYNYEGLEGYKAFDNNDETRWNSGAISGDEWPYIGYEFPIEVNVKKIYMLNYTDKTNIKKFKLQYSINGADWTDATESLTAVENNCLQRYEINTSIKAKYWRIQIEENYGFSNHNCSISELQFYAEN